MESGNIKMKTKVEMLKKYFIKKHDMAGDEIDFESEYDNSLTYEENKTNLERRLNLIK